MAILVGTRDGVYRTATAPVEDAEQVLDSGDAPRVRTFPAVDGVFAASNSGLYRSTDDGQTWENLGIPREEVYSVVASSDGERIYAGTHPAHLYVSTNDGETWDELEGFQDPRRVISGILRVTATRPTSGVSACIRRRPTT